MKLTGILGIDVGTQGLSVVFVDQELKVVATGDGSYQLVAGLETGCYEQRPADWESALMTAMQDLRDKLASAGIESFEVESIGIAGQMHGEVLIDASDNSIGNARLWCDGRNDAEAKELTELFAVKVPKRMTVARWLWTSRNDAEKADQAVRMTTPAGWLAYRMTGEHLLGIGDASGMFPIDQSTLEFDANLLEQFETVNADHPEKLRSLLPNVRRAGDEGGILNTLGAQLLGLPTGIPVAPAEGDQPAALAGSLIAEPGLVSASFGTSVCANSVGDRPFEGVSQAVDHFCAVDGRPINMVLLRNGTTFMNAVAKMFAENSTLGFDDLMHGVLNVPADCGGLIALPFMDDEPGLGIDDSGNSGLFGLNPQNATAGNAIKAALLASILNLKAGLKVLDKQGFPRNEIVLTGGLTKTPDLAQIIADVLQTPVVLNFAADEGTAYGAALMAKFRLAKVNGSGQSWATFVQSNRQEGSIRFEPNAQTVPAYAEVQKRYWR